MTRRTQPFYAVERYQGSHDTIALQRAALALYNAGLWMCPTLHPIEQGELWEALRLALGLPPGHATSLGVGSDNAPNGHD